MNTISIMRRLNTRYPLPVPVADDAVLRRLQSLRDDYGAVAEESGGWRLTYSPAWWRRAELQRRLRTVTLVDETSGTNRIARYYSPPMTVIAEYQAAGRGRRGRCWWALPGDAVTLSVVLPAPALPVGLSVAIGAVLWKNLAGDTRLRLKWPNDLLTATGEKVAGILIEIADDKVIVGIGVNRRMTPALAARIYDSGVVAGGLDQIQSSLLSRDDCAAVIVRSIEETVAGYHGGGFASFRSLAVTAHRVAVGEALVINGGDAYFDGFDDDGALLTRGADGVCRHTIGELSHVACR